MAKVRSAVEILITANGTQAAKEFEKVGATAGASLKKAQTSGQRFGSQLTKVGVASVGMAAVIGAGLHRTVEAFDEAELSSLKLENTIKNQPRLAGASKEAFDKQARSLEGVTTASHVATTEIQATLGRFKLTQIQILQTTPLVVDLARKLGIDTVTAATQVGKSFGGSNKLLKSLGSTVKLSTNDTVRYTQVIEALRTAVGGYAREEGKTFNGQLEITKNKLKSVEEGIGAGAAPAFETLLSHVGFVTDALYNLDPATQKSIGSFLALGDAALAVGGSVATVLGPLITLRAEHKLAKAAAQEAEAAQIAEAAALRAIAVTTAEAEIAVAALTVTQDALIASSSALANEAVGATAVAAVPELEALTVAEITAGDAAVTAGTAAKGAWLSALGPIGLLVGATAGIAFAIDKTLDHFGVAQDMKLFGNAIKEGKELTGVIDQTSQAFDNASRGSIAHYLAQNEKVGDILRANGLTADDYSNAVDGDKESLDAVTEAFKKAGGNAKFYGISLLTRVETTKKARRANREYNQVLREQMAAEKTLGGTVEETSQKVLDAATNAARAKGQWDVHGRAVDSAGRENYFAGRKIAAVNHELGLTADQLSAATESWANYESVLARGKNAALDIADAEAKIKDDGEAYVAAVKEHGKTSDEAAAAQRDWARDVNDFRVVVRNAAKDTTDAQIAIALKQEHVNAVTDLAPATIDRLIKGLKKQMEAYAPGSPMHEALNGHVKLLEQAGVDRHANVTATITTSVNETAAFKRYRDFIEKQLRSGPFPIIPNATSSVEQLGPTKARAAQQGPHFSAGGPIPGPVGAPVAATVHGGEYVLSREMIADITGRVVRSERPAVGASAAPRGTVTNPIVIATAPAPIDHPISTVRVVISDAGDMARLWKTYATGEAATPAVNYSPTYNVTIQNPDPQAVVAAFHAHVRRNGPGDLRRILQSA